MRLRCIIISMSPISTLEAAKRIGVGRATLERWLTLGKIKPPKPLRVGQKVFRLWTSKDIERVKQYKKKSYWTGQGRKPKAK